MIEFKKQYLSRFWENIQKKIVIPKNLSDLQNDILVQSSSEENAIASSKGDTKKMYYWVEE